MKIETYSFTLPSKLEGTTLVGKGADTKLQ